MPKSYQSKLKLLSSFILCISLSACNTSSQSAQNDHSNVIPNSSPSNVHIDTEGHTYATNDSIQPASPQLLVDKEPSKQDKDSKSESNVQTPKKSWSDTLSRSVTLTTFNITPGYGHVMATINNTSNSELFFSVQHTATGKIYGNGTVSPHTSITWRSYNIVSQGLRSGENSIQFRPVGNGNALKGTVYIKSGSTIRDVSNESENNIQQ